ncbi:MAG TPA: apolipoprotein N-acyltransferase [Candidatus Binatia bacterium]|nr:apolipoprotein N-acyltransferase [Candidatus Binatia bacterium]
MRQIHSSAWLFILLSAVLQVLIFPLPGLYLLSWIAYAPMLVALFRARPVGALEVEGAIILGPASPGQAFALAYVCGILWYAGTCYWIYDTMRQYGGLSTPMALLAVLLFCLYLGLYHGLFGLLLALTISPGRDFRRALVATPFLWVAVELARTRITGFPWNLLGTAQVDNTSLTRLGTVTGVYGISFEIMLVNVAVAAAFLVPKKKRAPLLIASLAAAAVLQAGRLIDPPALPADRSALLVQQNIPVDATWTRETFERTLRDLIDLTEKASADASGKSDLIVWPESPAPFFVSDPLFRGPLSRMASATHSWVVTGAIGNQPATPSTSSLVFNSAALLAPSGEWAQRYDKVHLVPFGEYLPFPRLFAFAGGLTKEVGQFTPGISRAPLDAGGTKLGVFICYESIFPDEVRQFADDGAQLLVNLSNDGWYGDSGAYAQHLNQTRMRAVENARWLLSATDTGVTASIDPYGRVVARVARKQRAVLDAPYALTSVTTFYTRHGDWFAFLCAIISMAALLTRFTLPKKAEAPA